MQLFQIMKWDGVHVLYSLASNTTTGIKPLCFAWKIEYFKKLWVSLLCLPPSVHIKQVAMREQLLLFQISWIHTFKIEGSRQVIWLEDITSTSRHCEYWLPLLQLISNNFNFCHTMSCDSCTWTVSSMIPVIPAFARVSYAFCYRNSKMWVMNWISLLGYVY